jgi:hypothetical protein
MREKNSFQCSRLFEKRIENRGVKKACHSSVADPESGLESQGAASILLLVPELDQMFIFYYKSLGKGVDAGAASFCRPCGAGSA